MTRPGPNRRKFHKPRRREDHPSEAPGQAKTPPAKMPQTHWGDVAQWYDQLVGEAGSEYHRHVVLPGTTRLLGLQAGEKALDVACGQGVLCRILHRGGVVVTGIDAAGPLIHLARERSDEAITFMRGDARELSAIPGLAAESFDAAACILAIQNIDPLKPLMESVARCLKSGGRFVIVMMHPCFRGPKETSWGWDDAAKVQYRRVDRYMVHRKEPIVTHPGSDPSGYTWTFHRPIQSYAKALRNAGMLLETIEEWCSHKTSEKGPRGAAEDLARQEIPMFMAMRAVKVTC